MAITGGTVFLIGAVALFVGIATLVYPNITIPGALFGGLFGFIWMIGGFWDAVGTFAILFLLIVLATIIDEYDQYKQHKSKNN